MVFVGEEPGTGGRQVHEEWREAERVSLDEAADRVAQSEWSERDFPVSSTTMFTDELLDIATGAKALGSSVDQQNKFNHYITNLEKCHKRYDEPDDDEFDETEYVGDQFYDDEYTIDKTAADCCSSYLRTELDLLRPQVVVTLGTPACEGLMDMYDGFGSKSRLTKEPFTVIESNATDWKLVPAMHPSSRNLNGSNSFSDIALPGRKTPEDGKEAREVYFDMLRDTLLEEMSVESQE